MSTQNQICWCLTIGVAALLTACGGGGGGSADTPSSMQAGSLSGTPTSVVTGTPPSVSQSGSATLAASTGVAGTAVSAATSCNIPNFQADMLRAVNEARSLARSCGTEAKPAVAAVAWNNALFAAAAGHSQDMAARNYFSHTTPEGVKFELRATAAGYSYSSLGENIAAGQVGIASVMASWLNSPGHCNGIMASQFTEVAVACVTSTTASYRTYWTMELGRPS